MVKDYTGISEPTTWQGGLIPAGMLVTQDGRLIPDGKCAPMGDELIPVGRSVIGDIEVDSVNARELHQFLMVGKDFSNWIKDRISTYDFVEGVDFIISVKSGENLNGRPRVEYIVTLDMAMVLAVAERHPNGAKAYKIFCSLLGKEVVVRHQKRVEFQFGEVIENMFSGFNIIPQYPVFGNKYYIDWYIPELKLAIEFDELHHWGNTKDDDVRQLEIEKELGCRFARYEV